MSIEELVLHVGMHKTGSTSIQSSLRQFDNGRIRMARLGDWNHSVPIYTMFASDPYSYQQHQQFSRSPAQIDQLREQYLDLLAHELSLQRQTLIISGEDISLLDADGVRAMHTYFETKVASIRVIAYVREPLGFASSAFQQYVRGGIRHALIPTPNYKQRFEPLINSFGKQNITFENFRRYSLAGGSVVSDFCSKTGIDHSNITERVQNESISFQATQLTLHFNQFGVPSTGNADLQKARKTFMLKLADMYQTEPKFNLPEQDVWRASDIPDIQWMEEHSGIRLINDTVKSTPGSSIGEASDSLNSALENISESTLRVLQKEVKLIDADIGKSANITNLLNVLFMSLYLEHRHKQQPGFVSTAFVMFRRAYNALQKPVLMLSRHIRSQPN